MNKLTLHFRCTDCNGFPQAKLILDNELICDHNFLCDQETIVLNNETQEDFEQTLDFLSKNQKYLIDDTIVGINFSGAYSLLPGTPDWNEREDAGIEIIQNQNDSRINWISKNNVDLTVKERVLRDLKFRKHAAMLRYGLPYNQRYHDYLQHIDKNFIPMSD